MGDNVKDIVRLSTSDREALEGVVNKGKGAAAKRQRAPMLLTADASTEGPAWSDEPSAAAREVRVPTLHRTRQAYVAQGLAGALERQRPTGRPCRTLDGAQAARLAAIACRPPPEGQARGTRTLRADQRVTLEIVEALGQATVRRTRKKRPSRRGCKHQGSCRRRAPLAASARGKTGERSLPGQTRPSARSSQPELLSYERPCRCKAIAQCGKRVRLHSPLFKRTPW